MSWLDEAIRDEQGLADIAYVSLFVVTGSVLGAIFFICVMTIWAFGFCTEDLKALPPVLCRFDPQPLGIAIAAICGGFATALAALAAYMAATRRQYPPAAPGKQDIAQQIVLAGPQQAPQEPERGTPAKPLHVAVKDGSPKRASKGKR